MLVKINEQERQVADGVSLRRLHQAVRPDADIIILNGAPVSADPALQEGDRIVFIRRGETPGREEMEALLAARHTPAVHEVVRRAVVGIAGLGGLGSTVAGALARIGVGKLILADFDVVEPSNLNRQQYFVDQIGMAKAEALRENLARINPYVAVEAHQVRLDAANLAGIFAGVDVMVEAFDTALAKAMIAESFPAAYPDTPLVLAMGLAGHASSNAIRTRRLGRSVYVVGDLLSAAQPGVGLMAPRVGVAAHHQANAVLRLLMGESMDEEAGA